MLDFFRNLNKEQLQKLLIATGIGIALLVALYYFLIAPAFHSASELQAEIDAARNEFKQNRALIRKAAQVEGQYQDVRRNLAVVINEKLAPSENAVSWVSSIVQNVANAHGVSVQSLSGYGTSRPQPAARNAPPPLFEEFEANLSLTCGYHDLGRFLAELERRVPYARLESLAMRPGKATDKKRMLAVNLRYAFPRFTEAGFALEQRPQVDRDLAEGEITEPEARNR